ncbi:MAG: ABC transporter permease [Xanthomonadales bacterium]|nr:ABC transporter permease [Xanthomonadales bacterium]
MSVLSATPATTRRLQLRPRAGVLGATIVAGFALLAISAWLGLAGSDWAVISAGAWESPSTKHWLGTNRLGQDIFARAVQSTATAFETGMLVAVSATLAGALIGGIAGWYRSRWLDESLVWLTGVLEAIPFYLFAAALAFAMHGQDWAMHLAMVLTFWTGTARLVRAEVMRMRELEYVLAARAAGISQFRILLRHLLPNTSHILGVQAGLVFVAAIKTEVILSFLGLGIQDGISWGLMLAESTQEVLMGQFGNFLVASTMLFLLALGINLVTDAYQERLSPREGMT